METYHRQIVETRSPQVLWGVLTTQIQVRLLVDDQIDHLDGVILVGDQPLDKVGDNGSRSLHQALPNSMTRGRRGRRRLLLFFFSSRWARCLLRWMVILGIVFFLFRGALWATLGFNLEACPCYLCATANFLTNALCLPESIFAKKMTEGFKTIVDILERGKQA